MRTTFEDGELLALRSLSKQYANIDNAVARIALLRSRLTLPKGVVHVFSDIHGEDTKLRHLVNNVSGRMREIVNELFGDISSEEREQLLCLIYYPRETLSRSRRRFQRPDDEVGFVSTVARRQIEIVRYLARSYPIHKVIGVFPEAYREIVLEMLCAPMLERDQYFTDVLLIGMQSYDQGFRFIRILSRAIRNLANGELLINGDMGDRGPRIDKVIAYLMKQPEVSLIWGNHDVLWMGAYLGQEALLATALRVSIRYGRMAQVVEGYGLPLLPLQQLAERIYGDDPCERFRPKVHYRVDPLTLARMQKAIAIIQFKLEYSLFARNPTWGLEQRSMLHKINFEEGTIELNGEVHKLADAHFPTIDPADPYKLSPEERECLDQLKASFWHSPVLRGQMDFLFRKGAMYTVRDKHLFFHGAVPVHESRARIAFAIRGTYYRGRELFDAFESAVHRAWREGSQEDVDLLWYLWAGPVSPLFAKDRMATFESYYLEDKSLSKEHMSAYFKLIHNPRFCRSILREFGVDPERGVIVNGHVPVKINKGEDPVRSGGFAVNIDGGFAEAYGDKGFTLLMAPERTWLAQHGTFTSLGDVIDNGYEMVPKRRELKTFVSTRRVVDTEVGESIRREISQLERLILAYKENLLHESRVL